MKMLTVAIASLFGSSLASASEVQDTVQKVTTTAENVVNEILVKAINAATQGAEFLKEQIPDVVRQLLLWTFWHDVIVALVWLFLLVLFWILWSKNLLKNAKEEYAKRGFDDWCIAALVPGLIGAFASIFVISQGIVANALEALQIAIAPKVWLLEYAAHLIRH
jgi:hypothetical protein